MKKVLSGIFAIAALNGAFAQQVPFYSQYYINPFVYNPALTGVKEDVNTYLIHRSQWKDIQGSPVTNALTIDGPLSGKNIGLGLSFFNDVTDIFERTGIYTSYSYKLPINDDSKVMLGLSAGILDNRINFANTSARDGGDPVLLNQAQRKATPDATFGAAYMWKDLEVGLAIPQLLGNRVAYPESNTRAFYNYSRHFQLSAKYTYVINEDKGMSVYPLVLARYTPHAPFQFDFNAVFNWQKYGWAAVSYKHEYAVAVNAGVRIKENLSVGYSYDLIIGSLSAAMGSGHEIMLGYKFNTGGGNSSDPAKDQEVAEMANRLSTSEAEIQKLNQKISALEALKTAEDLLNKNKTADGSTTEAQSNVTNQNAEGSIRKGLSLDFEDENENMAIKGDYIVVGSFKSKENAQKAKAKYIADGFPNSKIVFNTKTGFYNVQVSTPATNEAAIQELTKVRATVPEAWILRLE